MQHPHPSPTNARQDRAKLSTEGKPKLTRCATAAMSPAQACSARSVHEQGVFLVRTAVHAQWVSVLMSGRWTRPSCFLHIFPDAVSVRGYVLEMCIIDIIST